MPEKLVGEELEALNEEELIKDPLIGVKIIRELHGEAYIGKILNIEIGKESRMRFYRIQYADGDLEYLTEDELTLYQSMIGEDEFCKHFDQKAKMCTIYDQRPSFCVVKPEKMKVMFDIDQEEINDFCAFCCREQISDHYGEESDVMERFEEVIASLRGDDERDEEERSEGEIDPNDGGKWVSL